MKFVLLALCAAIWLPSSHVYAGNELLNTKDVAAIEVTENKANGTSYEDSINQDVTLQYENLNSSISNLENLVQKQSKIIKDLQDQLGNSEKPTEKDGMNFEVWSGFLLAIAALVLGAVGIGIAVFSFIGYNELINKGVEKATTVATDIAENVAKDRVSEEVSNKSKEEIERLIEIGYFDTIINEIVQRFMYRGVMPGSDFGENNQVEGDAE